MNLTREDAERLLEMVEFCESEGQAGWSAAERAEQMAQFDDEGALQRLRDRANVRHDKLVERLKKFILGLPAVQAPEKPPADAPSVVEAARELLKVDPVALLCGTAAKHGVFAIRTELGNGGALEIGPSLCAQAVHAACQLRAALVAQSPTRQFLVWSHEHGAWWGPNHSGYVLRVERAGRYTREEAFEICRQANAYLRRDKPPNEVPVRLEDVQGCV